MCVLICIENAYHANARQHRQKEGVAPQIQEVAPTHLRDGPHHVYGVALCSVWEWILEVSPQIQEVAPTTCMA